MAVIVVFGAVITPFMGMAEGWLVWWGAPGSDEGSEALLTLGPTMVVAALLIAPLCFRSQIPRLVRTALMVPLIHVGLMVALWAIWKTADIPLIKEDLLRFLERHEVTSLVSGDVLLFGALISLALLALGLAHGTFRRRRAVPGWLRPTVTFSIAFLFILGMWLPLAAELWASELHTGTNFLLAVVAVPALPALVIAIRAQRPWSSQVYGSLTIGLAVSLGFAVALRTNSGPTAQALFANMIPVILVAAMVSLGSVIALAVCQWRELRYHRADGQRTGPWVQYGVVESDAPLGTPVGIISFVGSLGGFRTQLAPFWIRTREGAIVKVPNGSRLSAVPGPASVNASPGDYLVALRVGDPVAATGYEAPAGDGPFRSSGAPVPSDRGVLVFGGYNPPPHVGVSLLLWRPCTLYMLAAMAAVIPALLGAE